MSDRTTFMLRLSKERKDRWERHAQTRINESRLSEIIKNAMEREIRRFNRESAAVAIIDVLDDIRNKESGWSGGTLVGKLLGTCAEILEALDDAGYDHQIFHASNVSVHQVELIADKFEPYYAYFQVFGEVIRDITLSGGPIEEYCAHMEYRHAWTSRAEMMVALGMDAKTWALSAPDTNLHVAEYRIWIEPQFKELSSGSFLRNQNKAIVTFTCLDDAEKFIREREDEPYTLAKGETGRPTMSVVLSRESFVSRPMIRAVE